MGITLTKFSGVIVAGNTSQLAIPANPSRKYLYVFNSSGVNEMNLGFGAAATFTGVPLLIPASGVSGTEAFIMAGDACTTQDIHIICPTGSGGETFVAYEGV